MSEEDSEGFAPGSFEEAWSAEENKCGCRRAVVAAKLWRIYQLREGPRGRRRRGSSRDSYVNVGKGFEVDLLLTRKYSKTHASSWLAFTPRCRNSAAAIITAVKVCGVL